MDVSMQAWYDLALGPAVHGTDHSSEPHEATHAPTAAPNTTAWCEGVLAGGTMSPTVFLTWACG